MDPIWGSLGQNVCTIFFTDSEQTTFWIINSFTTSSTTAHLAEQHLCQKKTDSEEFPKKPRPFKFDHFEKGVLRISRGFWLHAIEDMEVSVSSSGVAPHHHPFFNGIFHCKPSFLGYLHLWKPPYSRWDFPMKKKPSGELGGPPILDPIPRSQDLGSAGGPVFGWDSDGHFWMA